MTIVRATTGLVPLYSLQSRQSCMRRAMRGRRKRNSRKGLLYVHGRREKDSGVQVHTEQGLGSGLWEKGLAGDNWVVRSGPSLANGKELLFWVEGLQLGPWLCRSRPVRLVGWPVCLG